MDNLKFAEIERRISALEQASKNIRGTPLITGYSAKALTLNANLNALDLLKRVDSVEDRPYMTQTQIDGLTDGGETTLHSHAGLISGLTAGTIPMAASATSLADSSIVEEVGYVYTTKGMYVGGSSDPGSGSLGVNDSIQAGGSISADTTIHAGDNIDSDANIIADGDIYRTALTSWGDSDNLLGFSSISTNQVFYKLIGKTCFLWYYFSGVSNQTYLKFTLPHKPATSPAGINQTLFTASIYDNGVNLATPGFAYILNNNATCEIFTDFAAAGWTNSGNKGSKGFVCYEIA